jgi:hypothetical protein
LSDFRQASHLLQLNRLYTACKSKNHVTKAIINTTKRNASTKQHDVYLTVERWRDNTDERNSNNYDDFENEIHAALRKK